MSAREWRRTRGGLWFVAAWGCGRTLQEEGVPDTAEAQAIASMWLDAREGAPRSEPSVALREGAASDPEAARRVVLDIHRRMTAALDAARDAALEEWLAETGKDVTT